MVSTQPPPLEIPGDVSEEGEIDETLLEIGIKRQAETNVELDISHESGPQKIRKLADNETPKERRSSSIASESGSHRHRSR